MIISRTLLVVFDLILRYDLYELEPQRPCL